MAPADEPDGPNLERQTTPTSILFLCGMNAIRSPMAELLARRYVPQGTFLASAGVRPGERDPFVDVVLEEVGLDLGGRQPRTVDELEDDYFDLVISLAPEAHHRALEMTRSSAVEAVYWPTPDPTVATGTRDQIVAAYRSVRDHIETMIKKRFGKST
ncbi:MAG: low molecular weight phosphatase family protein [Pseudomonadota bacterium]